MNVGYKDLNTDDVAKMFKVQRGTITRWCHEGYVCAQDIAERGSKKARYLITETEVNRIKKLMKKYGKRMWTQHCREGLDEPVEPVTLEYVPDELEFFEDTAIQFSDVPQKEPQEQNEVIIKTEASIENLPVRKDFNADKTLDTILRIQELNERLQNIEAERNQIRNELSLLKKEWDSIGAFLFSTSEA